MTATQPTPENLAVRRWASGLLDRADRVGPIPAFGSPEWAALDDRDPRKPAAAVRAALAWRHEADPHTITSRLRDELDLIDRVMADRMTAVAHDLSAAGDWSRLASGPTARELAARRARLGPLTCSVDRTAASVWARTGTTPTNSQEVAA